MNIVGFNFTKINAERKRAVVGKININNNISINEMNEAKIGIGSGDRQAVRISFTFASTYTQDMAKLAFDGDLLLLLEKKRAEQLVKEWSDDKKIPDDIAQKVMSHILERCNIQALLVAKDLNLPSPVPLPKIDITQKGKQANASQQKEVKGEKKSKKSKK